jgi:galactokinase
MKISHDGDRITGAFPMRITDEYLEKCAETKADPAKQPGAYGCSIPEIDSICDLLNATDGVLGSQMLGAGLGGTVAALVEKDKADSVLLTLKKEYYDKNGFPMMADVYLPSEGSGVKY